MFLFTEFELHQEITNTHLTCRYIELIDGKISVLALYYFLIMRTNPYPDPKINFYTKMQE